MDSKLFAQAIIKFLSGLVIVGLLLFLPAGTFSYWQGWLLVGILFVCPFKLKKLGGKALYVLVAIGIIEFILLIWFKWRH